MARLKQHVYQHLRSAKEWLTKAEEAFDREHDVRAELDLMLAQAELQHVKEVNRSRQWRYKYVIFRHGIALTIAMSMAIVVGGVYWWTNKPAVVVPGPLPSQVASQVNLPVEAVAKALIPATPVANANATPIEKNLPEKQADRVVATERTTVEQVPEKPRQVEREQPRQSEQTVVVSSGEMEKLVRAAGKSLRGQ